MTSLVVEHIKNQLEDYRYWYNELKKLALKKYELDVARGVSAVRFDKIAVQGSSDPITKEINNLELIDKYYNNELDLLKAIEEMKKIQAILLGIENKKLVLPIFKIHCLKKSTYYKEANKMYYHEKTLQRQVNREIMHYVQKLIEGKE